MPQIEITTSIAAPIELVFDLARSIDAHRHSQTNHEEKAIGGRTSGLISLGETVTWEAVHFGIRQRLTAKIVEMDRPTHFRDTMVAGAFKRFDHDHFFSVGSDGRTMMRDVFDYSSPLGPVGRVADALFLKRYMTNLLDERNQALKQLAESGAHIQFINQD